MKKAETLEQRIAKYKNLCRVYYSPSFVPSKQPSVRKHLVDFRKWCTENDPTLLVALDVWCRDEGFNGMIHAYK
jgi:hypothetical protein